VNHASVYLPYFAENATQKWLDVYEQSLVTILFTEGEQTPVLWVTIATAFRDSRFQAVVHRGNRDDP
jgi:hypothetical protein